MPADSSFVEDIEQLARDHDFTGPISDRSCFKTAIYRIRNPKKVAERRRAWRKRNPDRVRVLARNRMKRMRLRKRPLTDKQRLAVRLSNSKWIKRNPEVKRAINHRRRARLLGNAQSPFTKAQWLEKVASYDGRCAYCDTGLYEHMDHIVALSRGGAHSLENVVPSCMACNDKKWVQTWTPRKPVR